MNSNKSEEVVKGKLLDFDWQIRHVMGSSTLRNLEETLTEVTFHVDQPVNSAESNVRNLTVEFTKNELKNLIVVLQRAKEQN